MTEGDATSAALEGGCLCGRVRYRVDGKPLAVTACHCEDCQKQSGSAFSMSLILAREQLTITKGEPARFHARAESGADKDAYFCGDCGCRIYNVLSSMPRTLNLKPGTLDDTRWLDPKIHVWTGSKQPWVPIPKGTPTFASNPKGLLD